MGNIAILFNNDRPPSNNSTKFTHNTTTSVQIYSTTEDGNPSSKYGDLDTRMTEAEFQYRIRIPGIVVRRPTGARVVRSEAHGVS